MAKLIDPNNPWTRRQFLGGVGMAGLAGIAAKPAWALAGSTYDLPFANGTRPLVSSFPSKGPMLLLRTRPPLLETPFEVFDQGILTPNDRFYVRWHLASIPKTVDPTAFRLRVRGQVKTPLNLTLKELLHDFPPFEVTAVNQCSGNSRGFFAPRVAGGEWGNGAMGNARWTGVRLKDVLDRAGVKADALQVRFKGADKGVLPATPDFMKSLAIDHARNGEVMLAYAMNGEPLPLLNGFPLRLVVPGWYATYWVKMLEDIEVLNKPDDNFWTAKAYLIPDNPAATMQPGQKDVKMVPISRMNPRAFFTNVQTGATWTVGRPTPLRGIALGGDAGVAKVFYSVDGGQQWAEARLGPDAGAYSFRRWEAVVKLQTRGVHVFMVKTVNTAGVAQPLVANWNGSGYMRNVAEQITVAAV